ncbi:hypothetical protein QQ045_014857 [Rhodiola kirilowii]
MPSMQIDVAAAGDGVEEQYVEMMVPLYSYGCERKIKKALSHLKGIYSVNVDFRQHKVTIWGICSKSDVLSTIKSKRKGACFWPDSEDCPKEDNGEVCQDDCLPSASTTSSQSPRLPHSFGRASRRSWSFSHSVDPMRLVISRSLSLKLSLNKIFRKCYSF